MDRRIKVLLWIVIAVIFNLVIMIILISGLFIGAQLLIVNIAFFDRGYNSTLLITFSLLFALVLSVIIYNKSVKWAEKKWHLSTFLNSKSK